MGKVKIISIQENKLVDYINDIVEQTIKERNLVPAPVKVGPKKITVTESQLRELQKKGTKINSITKKTK